MELQIHTAPQTDEAKLLGGVIPSILFSRPSLCVITAVLSGVDFWGRKCVKTALFYCAHCAVPPSPSGATHAIPDPEMYTTEYNV